HTLPGKRPALRELSEYGVIPSRLIFSIEIADRNGFIIEASNALERADIIDEAYFQFHRDEDWDWPMVNRLSNDDATGLPIDRLQFSRRLNNANGDFEGVVMVSVSASYFTSGYDSTRLGQQGVLGLLDSEGRFLVKRSGEQVSFGEVAGSALIDDDQEGYYNALQHNAWDGIERYTHIRSLYGFPLRVVVGLARQEQLAAFYQQRRFYLISASLATL